MKEILTSFNSFRWIDDGRIGQVLDRDETGEAVVKPNLDADSFARTRVGVEMVPHLNWREDMLEI